MDGIELRAAAVAAFVLGARAERRDFGGRSVRDFDLILPDGSAEPLEVTRFSNQAVLETGERLRRADRGATSLTRYWVVDVPNSGQRPSGEIEPYDVRRFFAEAESALREIEEAGHERFDLGLMTRDPRVAEAIRRLAQLGCDFGFSHELASGEAAGIHPVSGVGGVITDELIPAAIEREAKKPDNQAKLREPKDARRRHLFVVADSSTTVVTAAHRGRVRRVPALPPSITTAWIVGAETAFVVTPPRPWESHQIPAEVFDQPELWVDAGDG